MLTALIYIVKVHKTPAGRETPLLDIARPSVTFWKLKITAVNNMSNKCSANQLLNLVSMCIFL